MYKNYNMNQLVLPMPIDLEVMLEETDIAFVINDLVESVPDRAFVSFRVDPDVQKLLRQLFVQFHCQLVEVKIIDHEAIFINGTKIEANAN